MSGFAFASGEALDRAFSRVMRRQLRSAGRALGSEEAPALAVHRARRCLKRSRALLALLDPAFRKKRWAKEAKALKRAGRQLSGARDEQAKLDALDKLAARDPRAASASTVNVLRKIIEARRAKLERTVAHELKGDLARDLDRLGDCFRRKHRKRFDEGALVDGIVATYRRGRRAMKRAYESGHDEDFHAWRREVQTHWRHMQLIEACAPAEARPRADAAKALSGLLGEDHDLWLLLGFLDRRSLPLGNTARGRLKGAIARAQAALRQEAEKTGQRIYADKPKRLIKRLRRSWREQTDVEGLPSMSARVDAPQHMSPATALLAVHTASV